jgi:hypothetical protein
MVIDVELTLKMINNLNNRLKFGVFGGITGGLIAIVGYLILSPPVDSVILFVLLRVVIGIIVAILIGPIILSKYPNNKSN